MKFSREAVTTALATLQRERQHRVRRVVQGLAADGALVRPLVDGRALLNFSSNDYLGLAGHPRMIEAQCAAASRWGTGAGAAHLVTGHTAEHHALEEELADFTGREAALLFSTGYMANVGIITALMARDDVILQDKFNHASLIDGARQSDARLLRYAHGDAQAAARMAEARTQQLTMIATDGVFSMDGDIAPVAALARIARKHNAWLLVDDAHGFGVLGAEGGGTLQAQGLTTDDVPLLMGTLGKACGSFGAFVAGDRDVIDLILQRARSYIYTTALPPAIAAATRAALKLLRTEGWRRQRLAALIARFRAGAAARAVPLMASSTAIQPVPVPGAARCLTASESLRQRGFWVGAIRHPTVPAGTERLRVTLSAAHEEQHVDALLDALAESIPAVNAAS
ncbi:MAG TPA: 8-amino-7-oxononanoate synthase [Steroidobacteraceae bacterium]|nr:8-amino-7-oxononanoate synthase [Steroidobacteraceae bacterium]